VLETRLTRSDTISAGRATDSRERVTAVRFGLDGTTLYLALHSDQNAAVVRLARATGSVLERRSLPEDSVTGLWLLRDGQTLVAAGATTLHFLPADLSDTGRQIAICDGPITGATPFGVRDRAYAICGESTLVEIDSKLEIAVRSASVIPADSPDGVVCGTGGVATSPSGSIVYVLCRRSGLLLYIDRLTLIPFDSVDVGAGGQDMALVPGGRRTVITRPSASELVVVDLREREVESRLHVESPWSAAVGMDGRYAYVTTHEDQSPGRLLRIDLESAAVAGDTQALPGPLDITLWPSTHSPKMRWD
jgi:DNA-binding beta-propeller fold protein YncE